MVRSVFSNSCSGVVYVGSEDNKIYALNASNGELLWSYTTGDIVISRPAVAKGVVYVGSWDGKFYALNASRRQLCLELCNWRRD